MENKFITLCGLPRSGSTLLGNILNQHPDITVELDSCLSNLIHTVSEHSSKVESEIQHTMDQTKRLYFSFMRSGISSWVNEVCNTKVYIDKCRGWQEDIHLFFNAVPNAKLICLHRDLRGVISSMNRAITSDRLGPVSYESLYGFDDGVDPYNENDLHEMKIMNFLNEEMIKIPLFFMRMCISYEITEHLDKILFVRYEDMIENPRKELRKIYNFIGIDDYENNLEHIEQIPYHDAVFSPYGNHTIKSKLIAKKTDYNFPSIKKSTQLKLIKNSIWYYKNFYPEVLEKLTS